MAKGSHEKVIELFNSGVTKPSVIEERTGLKQNAIRWHIRKAVESGEIVKTTKYEQIVQKYNSETTKIREIADKLEISESTVKNYLKRAEEEGKIKKENQKTKYERVIELYNLGTTSPSEIGKIVDMQRTDISKYIRKAKEQGMIEEKDEITQKVDSKESKETKIEHKEEKNKNNIKIRTKKSNRDIKKEKFMLLYLLGTRDSVEFMQKIGISYSTYTKYMKEARETYEDNSNKSQDESKLEEELKHNEKTNNRITSTKGDDSKVNANKKSVSTKITAKKRQEIKTLMETMYPIDIAKKLAIRPYDVYNIIDSISIDEISRINKRAIANRSNINEQIETLQSEEMMGIREALQEIEKAERSTKNLFELADVYYILGAKNASLRIVDKIGKYTKKEGIKQKAISKRDIYEREFLARKISKSYRNSVQAGENPISYETLCKEFNTNSKFLEEILGEEEKDIGDK